MQVVEQTQIEFYQGFIMGRGNFDPKEFGISISKEDFTDQMVDVFNETYRGSWTINELLLHPREAAIFCDDVRRRFGYYDCPDDIILRVIMRRRKSGEG